MLAAASQLGHLLVLTMGIFAMRDLASVFSGNDF